MECAHNKRCRYTHGFYCEDCKTFFPKDSPTYRQDELMSSLWMAISNINAERYQKGLQPYNDIEAMKQEIGIGIKHDNYEDIITRAELLLAIHNKNSKSATITLKE